MTNSKTIFSDTNLFIDDPYFIKECLRDEHNKLYIPDVILSEMNGLKKNPEIGHNAREFTSYLHSLLENNKRLEANPGSDGENYSTNNIVELIDPSKKQYKGKLFITNNYGSDDLLKMNTYIGDNDLKIIRAAAVYKKYHPEENVVLVSSDKGLINIAKLNGVNAEFIKKDSSNPEKLNKGYTILDTTKKNFERLREKIIKGNSSDRSLEGIDEEWTKDLIANEYVIFPNAKMSEEINASRNDIRKKRFNIETAFIKRYDILKNELVDIGYNNKGIEGIYPKNLEQLLLMDQLLNNDIRIKAVRADAGTGKTFLELAVGLYKVINTRKNEKDPDAKLHVIRRAVFMEEYGFLPGDIDEKNKSTYEGIAHNYQEIMKQFTSKDVNLAATYSTSFSDSLNKDNSLIRILPFGTIRGRTVGSNDIVIAEEWQNTEIKSSSMMLSRNADGEVYINGDPSQVDNPHTSPERNGLTHTIGTIEKLSRYARKHKDTSDLYSASICATLRLHNNERGIISKWSENLHRKL